MTSSYVKTGPFTNGTAPGINGTFLNTVENALVNSVIDPNVAANGSGTVTLLGLICNGAIQTNPSVVTVNGTTSGAAQLYQFLVGTVKGAILYLNGYRNATTTEQTISFPTPFTSKCLVMTGNIQNTLTPYFGGSAESNTIRIYTSLASSGGAGTLSSTIKLYSIGFITSNFDAIGLGISQSTATNDIVIFLGL